MEYVHCQSATLSPSPTRTTKAICNKRISYVRIDHPTPPYSPDFKISTFLRPSLILQYVTSMNQASDMRTQLIPVSQSVLFSHARRLFGRRKNSHDFLKRCSISQPEPSLAFQTCLLFGGFCHHPKSKRFQHSKVFYSRFPDPP